jgi:two-component system nitrogen regulation response regulator GlnG
MSNILIVDDEASICWALGEALRDEGHVVQVAATAEDGLRIASAHPLDAVVLDVRLPGMDGLTAMRSFRDRVGEIPIIVITAFGNLDTAVRAIEGGAFEYLVKPFDLEQATTVVKRSLDRPRLREAGSGACPPESEALIGSSPAMQELFKKIALVAPTDVPVLITGESGTGKELVARAIHRHSSRRDGPFLPICPAALSPSLVERELFGHVKGAFTGAVQDRSGLLELASGGTVLLDEIGDVSPSLQVKLLRAIEHREVTPVGDARPRFADIRVVAATNRPLGELMASGEFREDLFFRLSVFQIHLPPLRDRREDIPNLAEHFLRQARPGETTSSRLSDEVVSALCDRSWTGNVRELRNAIEHAAIVARGQPIRLEHLPPAGARAEPTPRAPGPEAELMLTAWATRAIHDPAQSGDSSLYEQYLQLVEPPLLRTILEKCGHNRAAAAQLLGIHRATLRQKLRKYRIE